MKKTKEHTYKSDSTKYSTSIENGNIITKGLDVRRTQYVGSLPIENSRPTGLSLLKIVFIAILLIGVVGSLIGNSKDLSFTNFLQTLSRAPIIDTNWINFSNSLNISPSDFFGLGGFILTLVSIFDVLMFACTGIAQLVMFLLYFLRFMFF